MLKMAIPNKGALSDDSVRLMLEAGYKCKRSGRELIVADAGNDIEFVFLRPRDIALYVGNGIIDLGITGRDLKEDSGAPVVELLPLGFGGSRFCFAVPRDSGLTVEKLDGLRIATSYPGLLAKSLKDRNLNCSVVKLDGAVEVSVRLGVADAIADVVESGRTLTEAGLVTVGEPMLKSEALLIGGNQTAADLPGVRKLLGRLRGVLVAREYAVIEYDIPRTALERACRITPGIEAPTISPLASPDWAAVKAMIKLCDSNVIMDELNSIGARGIMLTTIRACRL